jgi:hypothetical protein
MTGGYLYINGPEIKNNTKINITGYSGNISCTMSINIFLVKSKIYKKK